MEMKQLIEEAKAAVEQARVFVEQAVEAACEPVFESEPKPLAILFVNHGVTLVTEVDQDGMPTEYEEIENDSDIINLFGQDFFEFWTTHKGLMYGVSKVEKAPAAVMCFMLMD